jgi:cytochrome d ubiquinol oxidase subunit II
MRLDLVVGLVLMASLSIYTLLGGADYGGGVWDLLAFGPRASQQREAISSAITPVWETNHVWLILVIVLLFSAFPPAFAAISTALYIPLFIVMLGIICRGASFTFRSFDIGKPHVQRYWGLLFSAASVVTPIFLGIIVGDLKRQRRRNRRRQPQRLCSTMAGTLSDHCRRVCVGAVCLSGSNVPCG